MKGKIYLLANWDAGVFKIGITKGDVSKRVKQLQTGNAEAIEQLRVFESEYYRKIESSLHKKYGSKRKVGEWFELTDEEIMSFTSECQKIHDMFKMLTEAGNPFL